LPHGGAVVVVVQVPAGGVPDVKVLPGKFRALPADQFDRGWGEGGRCGVRTHRPRLERELAFGVVAGQQFVDPGTVDSVGGGDLGRLAALDKHSCDGETGSCPNRRRLTSH
jgi:hypothetical protein